MLRRDRVLERRVRVGYRLSVRWFHKLPNVLQTAPRWPGRRGSFPCSPKRILVEADSQTKSEATEGNTFYTKMNGTAVETEPGDALLIVGILLSFGSGAFIALSMVTQRYALASESYHVSLFRIVKLPRPAMWFLGLVIYGVANGLYATSLNFAPLSLVASLFTLLLVWNLLFAKLILAERLTMPRRFGSLLIVVGAIVAVLGQPGTLSGEPVPTSFTVADVESALLKPLGCLWFSLLLLSICASTVGILAFERSYGLKQEDEEERTLRRESLAVTILTQGKHSVAFSETPARRRLRHAFTHAMLAQRLASNPNMGTLLGEQSLRRLADAARETRDAPTADHAADHTADYAADAPRVPHLQPLGRQPHPHRRVHAVQRPLLQPGALTPNPSSSSSSPAATDATGAGGDRPPEESPEDSGLLQTPTDATRPRTVLPPIPKPASVPTSPSQETDETDTATVPSSSPPPPSPPPSPPTGTAIGAPTGAATGGRLRVQLPADAQDSHTSNGRNTRSTTTDPVPPTPKLPKPLPPPRINFLMSLVYPMSLGLLEGVSHLTMKAVMAMFEACFAASWPGECSSSGVLWFFTVLFVTVSLSTVVWLKIVFTRYETTTALPVECTRIAPTPHPRPCPRRLFACPQSRAN